MIISFIAPFIGCSQNAATNENIERGRVKERKSRGPSTASSLSFACSLVFMSTHQINRHLPSELTKDSGYKDEENLVLSITIWNSHVYLVWYTLWTWLSQPLGISLTELSSTSELEVQLGGATGGGWDRTGKRPEPGTRAKDTAQS